MSDELQAVVEEAADNPNNEVPESRRALVKDIIKKVKAGKKHHQDAFKRMRQDQELVFHGTSKTQYMNGTSYVANIAQRHTQQRVSSLYAKNPKAIYERRDRRDYKIWDGDAQSIGMALQNIQAGILNPNDIELLMDYEQGNQRKKMLEALGHTLVILFDYHTDEQEPSFKLLMKQCVRRTVVTGVGYVKLDFQRSFVRNPSVQMHIDDTQARMDKIQAMMDKISKDETTEDDAEYAELEMMLKALEKQPMDIDQEGPVFGFPQSTALIIDPTCIQLQGFIGANWIAEEHYFEPDEVEEIFGVDLENAKYTKYSKVQGKQARGGGPAYTDNYGNTKNPQCLVWEFYNKQTGLRYFVMDGYKDFLQEPDEPNVDLERFFPYYSLVFNAVEDEKELFPPSDIRLIKPMQDDHNYARQGIAEHRKAARPKYITAANVFSETDKAKLQAHQPHHIAEIKGIQPGQKASDFISTVPTESIDPNLYATNHLMDDIQIVVGAQEANFGAVSKATATEASIAQGATQSATQSNIDDMDDFLSDIAADCGQVMLLEFDAETVMEIAGPGAVWPELTKDEIRKEVALKIEAGSSGRPNKSAELANLERVLPYIIQIPGVDPQWLAKEVLKRLDDRIDLKDAVSSGLPSITQLNGATGGPAQEAGSSPQAQGQNGQNNQAQPQQGQAGPQAAFPSPGGPQTVQQ